MIDLTQKRATWGTCFSTHFYSKHQSGHFFTTLKRFTYPMFGTLLGVFPFACQQATAAAPSETVFPDGCVRDEFSIMSPSMEREISVAVLRPPSSDDKPLPVLYALHGKNAPCKTFTEMSPLRKFLTSHPMLLVSFFADKDSAYIDATAREQSLFTTFFFDELMPEIAKRYATDGRQAITGFSMGGYGVMHYLLTKPELFTSASTMSGAFDLFDVSESNDRRNSFSEWL
ncbi:MAG: alpha/beta hydrolase, partial [Chthoniobacterales bacterium]